jgi:hypothetical protein
MLDLPPDARHAFVPANQVSVLGSISPSARVASKSEAPSRDLPVSKLDTQVLDLPKRVSVADAPNSQSQVLDLPKGDGHAAQ